jgi:membrane fusion protein, multidrug efflux system
MSKKMKQSLQVLIWLIVVAFIVVAVAFYWHYRERHPSTDDAYIRANIVNIAPQVNGPVNAVYVRNFQTLKAGQLLFTIDPRPFEIAQALAKAKVAVTRQKMQAAADAVKIAIQRIAQQKAQWIFASKTAARMLQLVHSGQASKQEGDAVINKESVAKAALEGAQNQLAQAKATLGQFGKNNAALRAAQSALNKAKLDLTYTRVVAPSQGKLVNFTLRVGNMLTAGETLFNIVNTKHWWAQANFKETQLMRIKTGQLAEIKLDIYPGHLFHGQVYRISPGSGAAFSLFPPENATGNWVKVTQRFPVKVMITGKPNTKYPLRVGASATVVIDTTQL